MNRDIKRLQAKTRNYSVNAINVNIEKKEKSKPEISGFEQI